MKRINIFLTLFIVVGGIGGAAATKSFTFACEDEPQYIRVGQAFVATSSDYACLTSSPDPVCTYYRSSTSPVTYTICKWGEYYDLTLAPAAK